MALDNGYPTTATIKREILQEVEIIGQAWGHRDPQGRVDIRLKDGRIINSFPADLVERLEEARR